MTEERKSPSGKVIAEWTVTEYEPAATTVNANTVLGIVVVDADVEPTDFLCVQVLNSSLPGNLMVGAPEPLNGGITFYIVNPTAGNIAVPNLTLQVLRRRAVG